VNEFFAKLADRLTAAASRRSVTIAPPTLEPVVADEVLELARVVAHTKERRFAPLASFVAGMAAERLRTSKAGSDAASVAAYIREVRVELEREAPPA